ncbi:MAG: DUF418 domain-containing protein [Xanthomonadales bacterium]|nr:DUF418 domain-containing protein [Xanthomonadales bacterium]MDH4020737.1 DUF418 domain-containing protein [Xanthomonadales bacterium]
MVCLLATCFRLYGYLWVVQMVLAHAWLSRYHYGPLEWLWRSATYLSTDVAWKRSSA